MNFKEYDEIIKEHKFDMLDMLFMMIYYNLQCNEDFKNLKEDDTIKLVHFIHYTYLKDENHIDLSYICDKALENKKNILSDKWTEWDLLGVCYE